MSDSMRPHRWQPTRLPRPWDSPGKNTGVGCHFPPQCMKVKSESEVAQSCPTLRNPMDCSPPGSSIHGIFQARVLGWGAIYRLFWCSVQFGALTFISFLLGEGDGTPLQYSCLENLIDGGAWWAAVHGVAKSRRRRRNR